ncbi:MAG: hypothetical protein IJY93_09035, partial [Clostridia bacterium]|nr:hypothetical protein [Clostridia bacterium]
MKRRLLSLLLAATLVVSSLPLMATANDSASFAENTQLVAVDEWLDNGAAVTVVTDTDATGDNTYIHPSSSTINPALAYVNGDVTFEANTAYKMTVWLRTETLDAADRPGAQQNVHTRIRLNSPWSAQFLSKVGDYTSTTTHEETGETTVSGFKTISITPEQIDDSTGIRINDTWTEYTVIFEIADNAYTIGNAGITFSCAGAVEDMLPVDIDGLSIVKVVADEEGNYTEAEDAVDLTADYLTPGKFVATQAGAADTVANIVAPDTFYTATSLKADADMTLPAGVYELTGDMRLGSVTYNDMATAHGTGNPLNQACATLKARFNEATVGSVEVLAFDFNETTMQIVLPNGGNLADLSVAFDDGRALEYTDLTLTFVKGIETDANWVDGADGDALAVVTDDYVTIMEAGEPLAIETGANFAQFQLATLPAGTYQISFAARNDASVASVDGNYVFMGVNGWYSGNTVLNAAGTTSSGFTVNSSSINGVEVTSKTQFPQLSEDWTVIETEITSEAAMTLNFSTYKWANREYGPVNVKDLVIIDTATGAEVDYAFTPTGVGGKLAPAKYTTTAGVIASTIVPTASAALVPGAYTLTGMVRASAATTITATLNDASATAEVGTAWQNLSIELDIREAADLADLVVDLGGANYIHFGSLELALKEAYTFNADWAGAAGELLFVNDIGEAYIKLYGDAATLEGATAYSVGGPTLPAGNYKLTVAVRNDPENADAANTFNLRFGGYVESCGAVLKLGDRHVWNNTANAKLFTVNSVKANGVDYTGSADPAVTADWVTYELDITSYVEAPFKIIVSGDMTPINIRWNLEDYDEYTFSGVSYSAYGQVEGLAQDVFSYTTVDADVASIEYVGDDATVYGAGQYTVAGKVRASVDTTLNATINIDSASVALTAGTWQDVVLPITATTDFTLADVIISAGVDFDFTEFTVSGTAAVVHENWGTADGAKIFYNDVGDGYIQLVDSDTTTVPSDAYYAQLELATLAAGTYTFTADVRNSANTSTNVKNGFYAGINGWYSGNSIFYPAGANANSNVLVNSATLNGEAVDHQFPILKNDWQTYSSNFTVADGATLYIAVYVYGGMDYVSADLKNLTITNEAGEEVEYTFTPVASDSVAIEIVSSYYTEADAITYIGDDTTVYAPGLYKVIGTVMLTDAATLTATVNGVTAEATPEANKWTEAIFEIDARESFTMSDIEIDLGGAGMYFDDFTVVGEAYDADANWAGANDEDVIIIPTADAPYTKYYAADKTELETPASYRFEGDATLPAGDYTVSFLLRNDPSESAASNKMYFNLGYIESCGYLTSPRDRYVWNNEANAKIFTVHSVKVNGVDYDASYLVPTSDWATVEISFTSYDAYNLKIAVDGDMGAINIKDLTIDAYEGEYTFSGYGFANYKQLTGATEGIFDYSTTYGTGATTIKYIGDNTTEYAAGVYMIEAYVRGQVGEVITVDIKGGTNAYTLETAGWQAIELAVDVPEAFTMSDVTVSVNDYIDFTTIELAIDEEAADEVAAMKVYNLIEAIGEVTLESGDAIANAETAYANLTETQKALVTNYETLTAAREAYDALVAAQEKAEADKAAAYAVIVLIDEIGEVTFGNEAPIIAAEEAYANLTDDQKALVTNLATLEAAREAYDAFVPVAQVGETKYLTIEEALAADGDITLLANVEDEVAVAKVVSIIKNGFTANVVAADGYELIETDDAYNVYTAAEKFDLSGVTMTLGASLSLDFAINTSKLTGTDNYAQMTIVYADGRPSDTIIVPQSEWTVFSGKIYTAKFTGMAAKQMNDVVTAVVYNANGQAVTNAKSDSIETYAVRMLNGSAANNAKLRAVYVDMLNYGAAAQVQFTYDEANLAN